MGKLSGWRPENANNFKEESTVGPHDTAILALSSRFLAGPRSEPEFQGFFYPGAARDLPVPTERNGQHRALQTRTIRAEQFSKELSRSSNGLA
jgi:hypothetical protein